MCNTRNSKKMKVQNSSEKYLLIYSGIGKEKRATTGTLVKKIRVANAYIGEDIKQCLNEIYLNNNG